LPPCLIGIEAGMATHYVAQADPSRKIPPSSIVSAYDHRQSFFPLPLSSSARCLVSSSPWKDTTQATGAPVRAISICSLRNRACPANSTASGSGSLAPLSASIPTFWLQPSPTSWRGLDAKDLGTPQPSGSPAAAAQARPLPRGAARSLTLRHCPLEARLCCKTRKLQCQEFFAKKRSGRRSPIRIPSVAVPKSPVSLTREDQSPHVFTRKTRLQPAEFLITCAKRLLQHNQLQSGHQALLWRTVRSPSLQCPGLIRSTSMAATSAVIFRAPLR